MSSEQQQVYTLEEFDCLMGGGRKYCTEISPAFAEKNVAIAIVSSDEYCPFAAVVIASIIANASKENNYDIVLLTNDMLQRNIWRIEAMAKDHDNVSIRVLDISKMIEGFTFYTWAHFTPNTYYRLLTPDVFSKYEKVIYLDSDIVVNHDIAELYNTDISGYYLGCALDTHVVSYCTRKPPLEQRKYNIKKLKMKDPEQYFQAGVSVFNITKIRADFGPGYLLKQGMENQLRWLDQDLVNMLFYGHIKQLPNKWNVMISNIPENLDEYHLPEKLRKEYFEARLDPYIIHYVGKAMPCCTLTPDLYEYFWKYARQTVFYEILLQQMSMFGATKLLHSVIFEAQMGRLRLRPNIRTYISTAFLKLFPYDSKQREFLKKIYHKVRSLFGKKDREDEQY